MKYWIIHVPLLPVSGMAVFPFILLKHKNYQTDEVLINHERIHLRQQIEMLILPFYMAYLINYLINLLRYKNHYKSYVNIVFEREAFSMDKNLAYLRNRKFWSWIQFFRTHRGL